MSDYNEKKIGDEVEIYCGGCGGHTEHIKSGFMPSIFIEADGKSDRTYVKTAICTICESVTTRPVTEEDVDESHKRYLHLLVDNGLATKKELEEDVGEDVVPW